MPVSTNRPRRRYVRHGRASVRWLAANYSDHTLKECAAVLGISWQKVKYICRSNDIRKRAVNRLPHPKKRVPPAANA